MSGTQGRPRRWVRWLAVALVILVVLPVAGIAVFLATFDLDAQKPRIQAAVQQATGRQLTLAGDIGLKLSLVPTLTVEGVSLANMPSGSRPEMLTVRRAEVELALLPLLSRQVAVRRLVLVAPDILLETDRAGHANWAFAPEAAPGAAAPPAGPAPAPGGPGFGLAVDRIAITEGQLTWRDGATGRARVLGIPRFEATAGAGPLAFGGDLVLDGTPLRASGEAGPLAVLLGAPASAPFPVKLALEAAGARLALDGSIAQPLAGKGWRFAVAAQVPDLSRLAPLLPDVPLPPLHDLDLTANLADTGGLPELSQLRLTLGDSALGAVLPGLHLARLTASLPRQDQPLAIEAAGTLGAAPLALSGTLGAPALLLPGRQGAAQGPWPVDLALRVANAEATVKGAIADPARRAGVDLALGLKVPALAELSALAGTALPPVRDLVLETHLAERTPGFVGGALLRGLRVTSSAFDAAGDLTYIVGQRPGLAGTLTSSRIDLDALKPPAAPAAPAAAPAAPPPQPDGRVIPDTPLPLAALKLVDADLRWQIGTLLANGVTLQQIQLAAKIEDGHGQLDLPTATLPGGRLSGRLGADATAAPPGVQARVLADGLDVQALAAALGAPGGITGRLELDLDVQGRGGTLRAVAATATGHAAVALTSGQVEQGQGSMLARALGELRQAVPQLGALAQGRVAIACAATRFALQDGIATSQALLLDSSLGKVGGGGTANLRDETLAMRFDLDLSVPVPGVSQLRIRAPVPVTGQFAAPRANFAGVAAGGALGTAEGLLRGQAGTAGSVAEGLLGALGGQRGAPGGGLPECGPVLATVRGGRPGPVPASQAPDPQPSPQAAPASPVDRAPPAAQQLLRGLLGR